MRSVASNRLMVLLLRPTLRYHSIAYNVISRRRQNVRDASF